MPRGLQKRSQLPTAASRSTLSSNNKEGFRVNTPRTSSRRPGRRLSGRLFETALGHFEHVAHFVDQQADDAARGTHQHVHRFAVACRHAEPGAHIERGDDLPPQVNQPAHRLLSPRHLRHRLRAQHFLHLGDVDTEQQVANHERAQLAGGLTHAAATPTSLMKKPGSWVRITDARSMRSVTWPCSTIEPSTTPRAVWRSTVKVCSTTSRI